MVGIRNIWKSFKKNIVKFVILKCLIISEKYLNFHLTGHYKLFKYVINMSSNFWSNIALMTVIISLPTISCFQLGRKLLTKYNSI